MKKEREESNRAKLGERDRERGEKREREAKSNVRV